MKKGRFFLFVLALLLITTHGNASDPNSPLRVGWVIGADQDNTTVILHTRNGGQTWQVQVNNPEWKDCNDISAVDRNTAWAAVIDASGNGVILHTSNGGATWNEQTLPEGVDPIKNIKGLTRHEAWAVSLCGTILHTTDGGNVWNIVDSGIDIGRVNRMDAIGFRDLRTGMIYANVWIVDEFPSDPDRGMIHSLYNGEIWRQEEVFSEYMDGVHMVSAYSSRVVWAAVTQDSYVYHTIDGGETWTRIAVPIGPNDLDDLCAYSADGAWAVQYQSADAGFIQHITLEDGKAILQTFNPAPGHAYEGLTCIDDQTALAVGYSSLPKGIIVSTTDGGQNWTQHSLPVDDVIFWKVSFVGARR